jgi:MtN3 and saliva related transmembrane protein
MPTIEIIGLIAATLTTACFIPQVYKVYKEKSTKDISLVMYIVFMIGLALWLWYGIEKDSISMILANSGTLLLVIAIFIAKLKYK